MDMPQPSLPRRYGQAPARGPGRPGGDSADQRKRLLDSAIHIYTRDGIAAARLRDIASEAHVTPALIGYYFGGKDQLAQAVVEERIMPAIGMLRQLLESAGNDTHSLLRGFVRGVHALVAEYPWLPALWVREILNEGGALRDVLIKRVAPQLPQAMAERFADAQKQGSLNADLDPRLLVISLIGLTLFPLAAEPIWRQVFATADIDSAAVLRHTFALLDHGLEARHAT